MLTVRDAALGPGYWSMPPPEKVQYRASYGLFFGAKGMKI